MAILFDSKEFLRRAQMDMFGDNAKRALPLDVSDWKVLLVPMTGAQQKLTLEHEGKRYLLKFPKINQDGTQIAYHVSEHVSCTIAKSLGYDVQETQLVRYRGRDAVLVTMFDRPLICFTGLGQSTLSHEKLVYDLDAFAESVQGSKFAFDLELFLWDTFTLDGFICNLDRHPNNWGFFKGADGLYTPAPLFDLGDSLYSIYADRVGRIKDIDAHIIQYSGSAIKYNGQKHNFRSVIGGNAVLAKKARERFCIKLRDLDLRVVDDVRGFYPNLDLYCDFLLKFFDIQKGWYYARA